MTDTIEIIPVVERVCDLCNRTVSNRQLVVTRSFVLTDWGVLCTDCWDTKIVHHKQFRVARVYIKAEQIKDSWARLPLVLAEVASDKQGTGFP